MSAPSKLQRWLDVVAFLANRHFPVSTEELWEGVPAYADSLEEGEAKKGSAAERMFERDKKELRALGIPIETVTYHVGHDPEASHGYRLARKSFHLPYLRLVEEARRETAHGASARAPNGDFLVSEDEAGAALDGLREIAALPAFPLSDAARGAFRKLAFDLDPTVLAESPVVYVADEEAVASADALRLLNDALVRRKRVTLRYHSIHRDETAERSLEPFGLLFQHGRWYLAARDPDRDPEPRLFRVGRMTDVRVNTKKPGTPDYDVPGDFDLEAYGGRSAWELGEDPEGPVEARVKFRFPRSAWADRNGHGTLERELGDGAQIRTFTVRRRDPFVRWVLSLAGDARILDPPELRDAFGRALAEVRARYGGGDA